MVNEKKVAIVGCGFVGSSSAFALMQSGLFSEMVLIDVDKNRAEGEALDIAHGMTFAEPMKIYAGDYSDVADAAMIVVTAGAAQKPGGVQRHAGNLSAGPSDELGIAMLAHDVSLDVARVNLDVGAQHLLQTTGVEHGTGADNVTLGQAGHLDGSVGQNVNRVRDDQQDAVKARLLNLGNNGLEDVDVLVDQV